jgi:uncharacterized protein YaaQ
MKLVIGIIRDVDSGPVVDELITQGFRVTRVASTGGFLRRGNVTLLIGVEEPQVDGVIEVFKEKCTQPEENQNRATVFVVNAPYFEQI